MFIYLLREKARERMGRRGAERENPKQAPCCQHRECCGAPSHKLRSWPEPKSRVWHSTNLATQAPYKYFLWKLTFHHSPTALRTFLIAWVYLSWWKHQETIRASEYFENFPPFLPWLYLMITCGLQDIAGSSLTKCLQPYIMATRFPT